MNETELKELEGLLAKVWNNDRKMIDHCMENCNYIKIENMFVDIGNKKPSINKTLWYDDTKDSPGEGWETFKFYNRHNYPNFFELKARQWKDLYFMVHYHNDKSDGKIVSLVYEELPSTLPLIRQVTEGELRLINSAINESIKEYEKRLRTYFKKYSKNIHAMGYWVDR